MLVSASWVAAHDRALRFLPLVADVAEGPDRAGAGIVLAHRRAHQLAPEAAAVAAHELDLLGEHAADAERRRDARAERLVELVGRVDQARRLAFEAARPRSRAGD